MVKLTNFYIFTEVPSAVVIDEVRPFSTTALIQFGEPESTGGVPILKYRAEWRMQGRGGWMQKVYEVQDGKSTYQKKVWWYRYAHAFVVILS